MTNAIAQPGARSQRWMGEGVANQREARSTFVAAVQTATRSNDPQPQTGTEKAASRRLHRRVPAETAVVLWVNSKVADPHARTANISEDGMFVTTSFQLPVGTVARFEMALPNQQTIRGFAEVIWLRPQFESVRKPNGMGFRYVVIRDDGREQLRRFLATQAKGKPQNNAMVKVKEQKL